LKKIVGLFGQKARKEGRLWRPRADDGGTGGFSGHSDFPFQGYQKYPIAVKSRKSNGTDQAVIQGPAGDHFSFFFEGEDDETNFLKK